ncbi:MAG: hypothetical protein HYZ92_03675 [Candidatus Omnitrophica bacterium]|nr:hypothetical protein [Candidatus Omnitrophota bacterium]
MPVWSKRIIMSVVGVGLAGAWLGEAVAHRRAQRGYAEAIRARRQIELEMGGLRAEREQFAKSLSNEQRRTEALTAKLSAREQELRDVVARLAQEGYIVQELQGRLLAMQQQVDQFQGELAINFQERAKSNSPSSGMVQLEKVVVTRPASGKSGMEGRVLSVHPEWRFVVVDLGWDSVTIGDVVSIYRENHLLGKARIERVQQQVSAATLLPEWNKAEIQVNDLVRAL